MSQIGKQNVADRKGRCPTLEPTTDGGQLDRLVLPRCRFRSCQCIVADATDNECVLSTKRAVTCDDRENPSGIECDGAFAQRSCSLPSAFFPTIANAEDNRIVAIKNVVGFQFVLRARC